MKGRPTGDPLAAIVLALVQQAFGHQYQLGRRGLECPDGPAMWLAVWSLTGSGPDA